jgi:hypothetical protein
MNIKVLALDLERTLISDAMNREPRPGLFSFLQFCVQHFERVVLFTSVSKRIAYEVLDDLWQQGHIPKEFIDKVEYIEWEGEHKDLRYVPNTQYSEILLIDDDEGWIKPEQKTQWIAIGEYDPYLVQGEDRELARVRSILETDFQFL